MLRRLQTVAKSVQTLNPDSSRTIGAKTDLTRDASPVD